MANMYKSSDESTLSENKDNTDKSLKPSGHTLGKTQIKEDWMKFMVERIKLKTKLNHTTNKEIEMTIKRARPILFTRKSAKIDPDMPDCYYWTEEEVSNWIGNLGFPEVKEIFLLNNINGRRLINIDVSTLNKMGLQDLNRMMEVTKSIRKILQIPPPNALRAIMRLVPWEMYLQRKSKTGTETDSLTFKKFCGILGFPYSLVKENKCQKIPPTCTVQIKPTCQDDDDDDSGSCISLDSRSSSASVNSLDVCPTVKFLVRNPPIRDNIIQDVLDQVIQTVFEEISIQEANEQHTRNPIEDRVREIFNKAYLHLGIEDPESFQQRVEFVASLTEELMNDVLKTRTILKDIKQFQTYVETSMNTETILRARDIASEVLKEISPIAALLALGQLEPGTLIRGAPGLQAFVSSLITTAENEAADLARETDITPSTTGNASTPMMNLLAETRLRVAQKVKSNSLSPVKVAQNSMP